MTALTRRLRSLLIALSVLALSAGAVLAGQSALSAPVRPDAAVTHGGGWSHAAGNSDETRRGDGDETETPDTEAPAAEPDADTPEADVSSADHPDNHGKLVSEAAQAPTPASSDNHGQYVRTIARDNHGQATAAAAKAKQNR